MIRLAAFAAILLLPLVAVTEEETYSYLGGFEHEVIYIKEASGGLSGRIGFGDSLGPADLCKPDSQFVCLFSQSYAFAVPRTLGDDQESWTVRGHTFEVVERDVSISLLGRDLDGLMLIRSPSSATLRGQRTRNGELYLYSPEMGLVAFGFDSKRTPALVYWLMGERGFGAK